MQKFLQIIIPKIKSRRFVLTSLKVAGIFVAVNVIVFLMFQDRTYPNTQLAGKPVGGVKFDESFARQIEKLSLVPSEVTLAYEGSVVMVNTESFSIKVDYKETVEQADDRRSWLPVANLFMRHEVPLYLTKDDSTYQKEVENMALGNKKDPVDARIEIKDGTFVLIEEQYGSQPDIEKAKADIIAGLQSGQSHISVPAYKIEPKTKKSDLEPKFAELQKQLQTSLVYKYEDKSKTYGPPEIIGWYVEEGSVAVLSDAKIKASLTGLGSEYGIGVQNINQAVAAAKDSLTSNKNLEFTLVAVPKPKKAFAYCTAVRSVDSSYLPGLEAKLAAVFADKRGWGLEGQVVLTKTSSGCDFTVWLSAASQMPTFGGICDSTWSCRVGPNVVINFDRWQNASAAWNASGGSLDDYRSMVINHETGHWFGFYHKDCTGAGQPAPVMQQQSISLQGCTFNPWPLASERAALKANLGL